jgi:hypothetical protein
MSKRNDNKERLGLMLCGDTNERQDLRSVTIQADEPPGYVDKGKWLERGGRFSHGADGRRCCEAANGGRDDCTQAGHTAAHAGRRKTVPTRPCAPLCAPGTGRVRSLPLTAVSASFGRFTGDNIGFPQSPQTLWEEETQRSERDLAFRPGRGIWSLRRRQAG